MYLRHKTRKKNGKTHRYWSIVEQHRVGGGRTAQRRVLYLGEINDSQRAAWCGALKVFDRDANGTRQMAIFPEDREPPTELDCDVVQIRLGELAVRAPRQWGGCWLALELWKQLELDTFWSPRLPANRQRTRWLNVFKTLVVYLLLSGGSEWRLHRHWYQHSAMADLLGESARLGEPRGRTTTRRA